MAQTENMKSEAGSVIKVILIVALTTLFVGVSIWRQQPFAAGNFNREVIGTIIAAGLTLIMYSFLYRDNPLFKIAENLYVGVALGYGVVITWRQGLFPLVIEPLFLAPTSSALWAAIMSRGVPIILGLLLLTRLSGKHSWLSRYSYAPQIGWGSGLGIAVVFHTLILKQLQAAIGSLVGANGHTDSCQGDWCGSAFSQWLMHVGLPVLGAATMVAGTVCVLFYFFFSVEHKRLGKATSNVGIWFLMVSFGATFGSTVMGRMALLVDRFHFLMEDWLKFSQ